MINSSKKVKHFNSSKPPAFILFSNDSCTTLELYSWLQTALHLTGIARIMCNHAPSRHSPKRVPVPSLVASRYYFSLILLILCLEVVFFLRRTRLRLVSPSCDSQKLRENFVMFKERERIDRWTTFFLHFAMSPQTSLVIVRFLIWAKAIA